MDRSEVTFVLRPPEQIAKPACLDVRQNLASPDANSYVSWDLSEALHATAVPLSGDTLGCTQDLNFSHLLQSHPYGQSCSLNQWRLPLWQARPAGISLNRNEFFSTEGKADLWRIWRRDVRQGTR